MPGDRIILEGERGNEMFFMTDGTAEIVIRRSLNQPKPSPDSLTKKDGSPEQSNQASVLRIHKKKGDFFGEVTLSKLQPITYFCSRWL